MNKLGSKTWLAIVIFSLCGQIAWTVENMLFNVFIQNEFNASLNNIALMVSLSAVAATLTTLFIGALSDKVGKRKVFICAGYLLWGLSIMGFALLKVTTISKIFGASVNAVSLGIGLTITFDCIMTFFGSGANDACFNAWMTDISDNTNRGKVEGVNSAMPLLSILVVFGGQMVVQMFVKDVSTQWTIIFFTIGILVLIVGVLGIFLIKEEPRQKNNEPYFKNIFYGFRPSVIKNNKLLYYVLLGFMVFSISVQVFMPYLILYFVNTLGLTNYVLIFAPAIILAAVFTIFYGRVIDKKGFIFSSLIATSIYLVGLFILIFATNIVLVFIGTMLMMMGFLSDTAVFNASIRDYTPVSSIGMFQGIRITANVLIPMLVGPWIGSIISGNTKEGMFGVAGDAYVPSSLIFLGALIVGIFVYGIILLIFKKKKGDSNVEL